MDTLYDAAYLRSFYDAYSTREESFLCRQSGTLDGGTHIIAVVKRL